ncbi:uncharacterized protein FOMMEDRAFT_140947 [Fomitiporia mediterranea MF3/22]|uniref:uncharacterized protein n=1 Tax=Fomitiporia mediterranea (strain MF3/22) TaxID=694068 RepID=UPI0004409561|nr:uncharacterized protein FOMMEDRAFT_140947 [Fomitiporia mediterranea MF3/22]EJD03274.1 hypothetical protein FOMMEDRAFT_140947 [Fomitiporia mediterranea MF3/22]
MESIQLKASPATDIWRKPPTRDVSNAPIHLTKLNSQSFHRARVTVSAPWTRLYDQGGLLILLPTSTLGSKRTRAKAGIEYVGGRANLSVVAAREWADWSLSALDDNADSVTIEFEREEINTETEKGSSLFVYVVKNGKRDELPVREVTWAFEQEGEIEVGVYAARPTKNGEIDKDELVVDLKDFQSLSRT